MYARPCRHCDKLIALKVLGTAGVKTTWIVLALQNINIGKLRHLGRWHAESKLAALISQGEKRPPSLKLWRDSLRSPLRCERRLEPRGFEPLTSSMPLRRSTN